MDFGEKLKQLRHDKDLTQPEAAAAMGIEQSYLSKLENDKSLPSNDVLNRILDVFELEIGGLVSDLSQGARNQLRQLPDVADYFRRQKQLLLGNRQRWLVVSTLLLSIGMALVYAGTVHMFFSDVVYEYKSHGIVLEGESKEIFSHPGRYILSAASPQEQNKYMDSIRARSDEVYRRSEKFQGMIFNVAVDGGSRTYYLEAETEVDPWQSKFVVFIGLLMAISGLTGIILDRTLPRYQ